MNIKNCVSGKSREEGVAISTFTKTLHFRRRDRIPGWGRSILFLHPGTLVYNIQSGRVVYVHQSSRNSLKRLLSKIGMMEGLKRGAFWRRLCIRGGLFGVRRWRSGGGGRRVRIAA